ncbi:hypothetical protein ABL78_7031 [Leptomonas seymouri]|uniref:FYVE-type domain-containing protein n=1 Tax=Leptomonas seymouri TaxID=5684 RepID=A0A0N1I177_LEPSE|nr:hypothetical protein ABL78_7031 [Leptomonas seymouri]|eukprot:KPI83931.1 hypothetical protein ABL78_7031 [Leptomonas seymouri]
MERDLSSLSNGPSVVLRPRGPPVLQVNLLYGMAGDEVPCNSTGPLGTATVAHSAVNLSRATMLSSSGAHTHASVTRRSMSELANSNNAAFSPAAASFSGSATTTSSLAKPVLDTSQVRCCPQDQWVPDAHVVNCMAPDCTSSFSLFSRKHRCRMCGRVFCASCCNNVVYISAAIAARAMPAGLQEGLGGSGNSSSNLNGANQNLSNTSPDPAGFSGGASTATSCGTPGAAAAASCMNGASGAGMRSNTESECAGSISPADVAPTTANQAGMDSNGGITNTSWYPNSNNVSTNFAAPSPPVASVVPCRVCASCSYEVQLVISTRQENGELRRRSRGELKMLQRALLVNVMTYLNLIDLANAALVSADFYFMSRDNLIWYQYNMTRWVQEGEAMQLTSLKSRAAALSAQQQRASTWYGGGGGTSSSLADDIFNSTPVIQDATALSESEAAKRVISLHARYNYTQFLDFAHRQEMAHCEGLSSFSLGARILLSSPIRVALVGPSGIGKTAAVHSFLGKGPTQTGVRPTIGFQRRVTSVRLVGGLSTEATLHIYDLSGADRYEELRRFVCRQCHVIGLCYDPSQKVTLVQAADIMMELEPVLGPQPVVVCGLLRERLQNASTMEAEATSRTGGGEMEMRPAPLASSHSTNTAESNGARKTLALAERSAQSLPVSGAAAAAATTAMQRTPHSLTEVVESSVGPPLSMSFVNSSGAGAAAAAPGAEPSVDTIPGFPLAQAAAPTAAAGEVSVEDAVGITVRGLSSIQCPMEHSAPLFEALVQAVLDRLGEATVANTTTISEISAKLAMQSELSPPSSAVSRRVSSNTSHSVSARVMRSPVRRHRPAASRTIVQDLLNLTMQPCALDVLLDRKQRRGSNT